MKKMREPRDQGKCVLCVGRIMGEAYGNGKCNKCKQKYEYDEAMGIKLSRRQLKILKKPKCKHPEEQIERYGYATQRCTACGARRMSQHTGKWGSWVA